MPAIQDTGLLLRIGTENNRFRAVFLLCFASLGSWMPNLNIWLEDKGMSGSLMGYLSAIPWLVMLIVQPFWGLLADRVGKMRCFSISILLSAALFSVFPLTASGTPMIAVMIFLFSIFQSPVLPLLDSLTLDHTSVESSVSYSTLRFWGAPGFGIGALLTGLLMPAYGSDVCFYLAAIFLVTGWLVARTLTVIPPSVSAADLSFRGLRQTLNNKMLIVFLVILAIVSIAQSCSSFFLTVYMREIGATPATTGTAIGIQALSELPFYFIAAWLLRKISPGKILVIAVFGTGLRLLCYYLNNNPFTVIGIETLNGVTWTLLWIASVEFVNEKVPAQWRTTGQSLLWAMYFGAGAVLGNVIIGSMYESMPMQQVFGIFSLLIFVIGVISFMLFYKSAKSKSYKIPQYE